jgi:ubiquitin C-terminal hydrolase
MTPAGLKYDSGRCNPRFSDFSQKDPNKLLNTLIDLLDEDLNHGKKGNEKEVGVSSDGGFSTPEV